MRETIGQGFPSVKPLAKAVGDAGDATSAFGVWPEHAAVARKRARAIEVQLRHLDDLRFIEKPESV